VIKRFKDGLLGVEDGFLLLQSYVPCPQKLIETRASFTDIGYETFFNPDPDGYSRVLELPEMVEHGIKTRGQLMELIRREYPDSYENGLKINNNLYEFGYKNWYWWCIANWGTMWEVSDIKLNDESPTELILRFHSDWSTPEIGLNQIAGLFPDLDFHLEYDELTRGFLGSAHWINGELVEHHLASKCEIYEELDDSTTPEDMEVGISVFDEAGTVANHFIRDM
jgi:hypothetical protein